MKALQSLCAVLAEMGGEGGWLEAECGGQIAVRVCQMAGRTRQYDTDIPVLSREVRLFRAEIRLSRVMKELTCDIVYCVWLIRSQVSSFRCAVSFLVVAMLSRDKADPEMFRM